MLERRSQPTIMYKIRAQANIKSNEKADKIVKKGREKGHYDAINLHKFAHATPYYYQKDWWHSMLETLDKGSIRFPEKHIIKHDRKNNLEVVATLFPNIDKWIANEDNDNDLSNDF